MKENIDPDETPPIYGGTDAAPTLEIYANEPFTTSDGKPIPAGNVMQGDFRYRVVCSVEDEVLMIPAVLGIYSTEDAIDNQQATYTAYLRIKNREPLIWLDQFSIPPLTGEMTSTSWARLRLHKAGNIARRSSEVWTKQQTQAAIDLAVGQTTKTGVAELIGGEVEVPHGLVTAESRIGAFSLDENVIGTPRVTQADIIPGESFAIRTNNADDNGLVFWIMAQ